MTDFTKRYSFLIIAISFFTSTLDSLLLPAIAENNNKSQSRPVVRVTTGIQQVQGWETGLVKANPNLARWHWDPIYSYKQGLARIGPEPLTLKDRQAGNKTVGNPGAPAYKYNVPSPQDNRPKHIPFSDQALKEVQARYSQAVKPQLPNSVPREENNVLGELSNKQTQAKLMPPAIATYGKSYAQAKLNTALKYSSDKTDVYGQLLDKKQKNNYQQAKTVKYKGKN